MFIFKRKIYFLGFFIVFFSVALKSNASPTIGVGSMYDVLTPQSQNITKRIYNTGTSTAFVRINILEINLNKKGGQQEILQKENDGDALERDRLIVTPLRLIIPPSGFQSVRILWPGSRDKERYFRVRFVPVLPEEGDGFGMDNKAIKQYREQSLKAGVNVLTGYGSVVIVQPTHPTFNTVIRDDKHVLLIKNEGNTTISLDDIRYCKIANTDCGSVSRQFIFPRRTFELEKKSDSKINFTLIEGERSQLLSY